MSYTKRRGSSMRPCRRNWNRRQTARSKRSTAPRLEEAIRQLPREQRRILELRHAKRLAIRKIAEVTNRSEDAVKSSLYRARRALAAQLPEGSLPGIR